MRRKADKRNYIDAYPHEARTLRGKEMLELNFTAWLAGKERIAKMTLNRSAIRELLKQITQHRKDMIEHFQNEITWTNSDCTQKP